MTQHEVRRVVHVVPRLDGAPGRYVVDTATEQERRAPGSVVVVSGHRDPASAPAGADALTVAGVPWLRCGDLQRHDTASLRDAALAMRTELGLAGQWPPELVAHVHSPFAALLAQWAGAVRIVATAHRGGSPGAGAIELIDALAYRLCDVVIAGREEDRTALQEAVAPRHAVTLDAASTAHLNELDRIYVGNWQASPWSPPAGVVRLHLGCGTRHREGWVNVDARADVKPDLVASAHALPMLFDSSVDVIEACHLFEHFPLHQARAALREWARVLKPGGELLLELPNFDMCVQVLGQFTDGRGDDLGMMGIYGWARGVELFGDVMAHRWGWSPSTLTAELKAAGFEGVSSQPLTQTWRPTADIGMDFRMKAVRAADIASAA